MRKATKQIITELIREYETMMKIMDHKAKVADESAERAYGGVVRATKGKLQEYITERLIEAAWVAELQQDQARININSEKIAIPIRMQYVDHLPDYLKKHIESHIQEYAYNLSVDKHVFIDDQFIMGIECKAYTENAMLKRIMVDFMLLKTQFPNLQCYLFQLESMLGGDYNQMNSIEYGSKISHSIMSYFPTVDLTILTLIKGERCVDKPIHKSQYFKLIEEKALIKGINLLIPVLKKYI